jgi:predicted CDP-diglyceride synthetase/phosphatidate cytidylyltransferase
MWSKAGFGLFVRFVALYLILAWGIAAALTAVATNFLGYNGAYTLELVATCFLVSLIGGWVTLLRLKRRILRGEDVVGLVKEIESRPRPSAFINHFILRFLSKLRALR